MTIGINECIKTMEAFSIIQDSIATGNTITLQEFRVSDVLGEFSALRTMDDLNPTWYTGSFDNNPFATNAILNIDIRIPDGLTADNGKSIKELYIIASYKGNSFLFAILQATSTEIVYYSTVSLYLQVLFNLTNTEDATIVVNSLSIDYQLTLQNNAWVGSEAPYTQTVLLTGLLSSDNPIVGLIPTGTYNTFIDERAQYNKIRRANCSNGTITFYAESIPERNLTLQAKVVRNNG